MITERLRNLPIFKNKQENGSRPEKTVRHLQLARAVQVLAPTRIPLDEIGGWLRRESWVRSDEELEDTLSKIEQKRHELKFSP